MRYSGGALRGAIAVALMGIASAAMAADFAIFDEDAGTHTGFDDATATMPVGGNAGTTLGEQRRIALVYAVRIVASRVASSVPIHVTATVDDTGATDLDCSRNQATLAFGGTTNYAYDFSGAPKRHVLYPLALANALAGERLTDDDTADVQLQFNGQLDAGRASCLRGTTWYYGLDGRPGDDQLDFVGTAVHEMVHGLGFESTVALTSRRDAEAGQFPEVSSGARYPDIFSTFIQDLSMTGQPDWTDLSDDERADSLGNGPDVVWNSPTTDSAAYGYLTAGLNQGRVEIYAPSPIMEGSSISHWSTSLSPNQLMEPYESPDTSVLAGLGMTPCVLQDLGWQLAGATRCPDVASATFASATSGGFVAAAANDDDDDHDNGGGGGGGCVLDPGGPFDPLWFAMLGLAIGVLAWRRRRAMG